MSIYSMTGYATACSNSSLPSGSQDSNKPIINIEARSVNSRFLDAHFRIPDEIRATEPALRALISRKLRRGKIELRLSINHASDQIVTQISEQALQNLTKLSAIVRNWLPDVSPLSITDVIRLSQTPLVLEDVQELILQTAETALDALLLAREQEGNRLAASLLERTEKLKDLAKKVTPLIPQVVEQQRQRFLERWAQALEQLQSTNSSTENIQERALAEATSFALRIDVAEELTRLNSHLNEIERLLTKGGEAGKRLDFLIQELHREANTLGSKSACIELSQISMDMKILIEQMREQVQNIE